MQFALQNVVFDANYQGQKNVVKVSAGTLTHYTIESSPRTWIVAPAVISLDEDNTPYYILARCSKSGESATIVFSKSTIRVEQEAGMYHFWIGVVNSVDETLQARSMSLTYGFSTINGRFIKTGRIESADGNTYFDLDAGEIRGNILFKGGKTLDNVVDTAIRTLSIGGRNLIKNSNKNQERKRGYLMVQEHDLTEDWKAGETYTISVCCGIERDKGVLLYIWGGSYQLAEVTNRTNSEDKDGLKWGVYTATFTISESTINSISDWHKRTYEIFQNGGEGDFILKWIKLEKGNKATDYTEAPEDTAEAIKKVDADSTAKANQALNDAKAFASEEYDKREKALRAEIMQDYLRKVIKDGSTFINGGLLATNVIALKSTNGNVSSYIDGNEANNIAFAAGVTDAFTANEKRMVEITHDGNARFGQMRLNGKDGVLSFAPIGSIESYLNIGGVPRELDDLLGSTFNGDKRKGDTRFDLTSTQGQDLEQTQELVGSMNIPKDGTAISFSGEFHIEVDQAVYHDSDSGIDYDYGRYGDDRDYWAEPKEE